MWFNNIYMTCKPNMSYISPSIKTGDIEQIENCRRRHLLTDHRPWLSCRIVSRTALTIGICWFSAIWHQKLPWRTSYWTLLKRCKWYQNIQYQNHPKTLSSSVDVNVYYSDITNDRIPPYVNDCRCSKYIFLVGKRIFQRIFQASNIRLPGLLGLNKPKSVS